MTETQRDEILLTLVDKLNENIDFTKNINQKLDENIEFTKNINQKLDENIDFTKNINQKLNENIDFTKNINQQLDENIDFTKRIHNSVAVIEEEHGSKLGALFDGYTANSEKLDNIQQDINNIYSILNKHEEQLYLLKSN